jgi:hypothetical protein
MTMMSQEVASLPHPEDKFMLGHKTTTSTSLGAPEASSRSRGVRVGALKNVLEDVFISRRVGFYPFRLRLEVRFLLKGGKD